MTRCSDGQRRRWTRGSALGLALALVSGVAGAAPEPPVGATQHEPTAADLATARRALTEGLELREKGDLPSALARLSTAYDLVQTPVTAFELGKAEMMAGHLVEAHELFEKVVRMPPQMEESTRSAIARQEAPRLIDELAPRIPTLRIHLKLPKGASAVVRIDDDVIETRGAVTPRVVDPGEHAVVAKAGDGPEQRVVVTLTEGETRDVSLAPQWIEPKPPPPPPGRQVVFLRETNPLVFVGFGGAAAAVLVTGFSGFMTLDAANRAKSRCGEEFCPEHVRQHEAAAANTWGAVCAISGGAAAGFLVMAIVSLSKPTKERVTALGVTPYVSVGSAGVAGRF